MYILTFAFFFSSSSHYTQSSVRLSLVHTHRFYAKERSFIGRCYDNLLAKYVISMFSSLRLESCYILLDRHALTVTAFACVYISFPIVRKAS